MPNNINTFVDLFGGSGTVLFNTKAKQYIYNDINNYVADILHGKINIISITFFIIIIIVIITKKRKM